MLKKFNTKETWIDVETLANLKGVSKRAIRLSFNSKNSNYETKIENGKGGKLYKIRLSSIEEELQIKYIHEYYDTLSTTNNIIELHNFEPKAEKIISFKQRELALAKYDLVKIWENYRLEQKQKGISKKVADREFLTTYNTGLLYSKKPAYMNRNEKLHKQIHSQKENFVPTIEQALILIKEWLKFKHSQPCPNNRNKTIAQMLATIQKQNIDESQLDDLMMDTVVKHIGRNGIRFLKADYFNDALYGIRGKCVVKYNLNDLSYI